jgi:hypothetical protein
LRITRGERFLQNDNERISLGTKGWPIFTFNYTQGLKGVIGSDFEYQKVNLNIEKKLRMGFWGYSRYEVNLGKVYGQLPYPLLNVHLGNANSIFFTTAAYNLMERFEFVSDEYAALRFTHHFEGNILNRVPLISKLKWRLIAHANVLYGNLGNQNINLIPSTITEGSTVSNVLQPKGLARREPYVEVGYGIENIFKIARIDAFHRITYLSPESPKFGVKISFQVIL